MVWQSNHIWCKPWNGGEFNKNRLKMTASLKWKLVVCVLIVRKCWSWSYFRGILYLLYRLDIRNIYIYMNIYYISLEQFEICWKPISLGHLALKFQCCHLSIHHGTTGIASWNGDAWFESCTGDRWFTNTTRRNDPVWLMNTWIRFNWVFQPLHVDSWIEKDRCSVFIARRIF